MMRQTAQRASLLAAMTVIAACNGLGVSGSVARTQGVLSGRLTSASSGLPLSGVRIIVEAASTADCANEHNALLNSDPDPILTDDNGQFTVRLFMGAAAEGSFCVRARPESGSVTQGLLTFVSLVSSELDTLTLNLQLP